MNTIGHKRKSRFAILKRTSQEMQEAVKQAERHDLCQITITVPRAVALLHAIREALKTK